MDSSFDTLYASSRHDQPRRSRSPRILTTIKGLVQRPSNNAMYSRAQSNAREGKTSKGPSRPNAWEASVKQALWKRRGKTPGMDDYLTMAQLENAWHNQDSYVGCVSAPQKITDYTYQEAVEVPLTAKHQPGARPTGTHRLGPDLNSPLPPLPDQNDVVIDGSIHPALRSAVTVPSTNWTYGRD